MPELDIKKLTLEQHDAAETQEFVKILMSGNIEPDLFALYLYNQHLCYKKLEDYAKKQGLFEDAPNLPRADRLLNDFQELWKNHTDEPIITKSTEEYLQHLDTIKDDPERLYTHIYVRHMGDMRGGQMIKKKTPGLNSFYEFSPSEMKTYGPTVKEKIDAMVDKHGEALIDEARICYQYATELFKELYLIHDEKKI